MDKYTIKQLVSPRGVQQQVLNSLAKNKKIETVMVNPKQIKKFQGITVPEGNKLTIYATESDFEVIISTEGETFVSESSIAHGSRPKDIPLAVSNYGKLVSSPMGNNITAIVRLPRFIASKSEFMQQMEMLYDQAYKESVNMGINSNTDRV